MRAIGYVRVSTVEQATEGMSLDAQESRIRAWAEATGAKIVEIVRDEGVSGTKVLSRARGWPTNRQFVGDPTPGS